METVLLLVRINAFKEISSEKAQLKWRVHLFYKTSNQKESAPELFEQSSKKFILPSLPVDELEQAFEEMELLNFPLCNPFLLLKDSVSPEIKAADFSTHKGKMTLLYGYLVAIKNTKTSHGDIMYFGTFQDYWGTVFETVHFPPVAKQYPFQGRGIYKLYGKVTEEFGYFSIEVTQSIKLNYVEDVRFA